QSLETLIEYPKGRKDSFRSSQELLFRETLQKDQSRDTMPKSRKLSMEILESPPLCGEAEGLAEPQLQALMGKRIRIAMRNVKPSIGKRKKGNLQIRCIQRVMKQSNHKVELKKAFR
ncbi:hypothetical protein E2320_014415, partial [Naja naja]